MDELHLLMWDTVINSLFGCDSNLLKCSFRKQIKHYEINSSTTMKEKNIINENLKRKLNWSQCNYRGEFWSITLTNSFWKAPYNRTSLMCCVVWFFFPFFLFYIRSYTQQHTRINFRFKVSNQVVFAWIYHWLAPWLVFIFTRR